MAINFEEVKERSEGKWLGIWRALGVDVDESGKHNKCPHCGGTDRFRVDKDVAEKGSYYCSQCGPGFGPDLIMKTLHIDIKEAMEAVSDVVGGCSKTKITIEKSITPEILRKIFINSKPIQEGDVAYTYLQSRGLSKIPPMLRYAKECYNPDTKENEHALLAVFSMPCSRAVTMQRIFLTPEGNKLPVEKPKKILPSLSKMSGGAVRLWPVEKIIGIGEGIETSIAASEDVGIPVWAALSTSLMAAFEPPPEVEEVVIFADNDKNYAGQKAAYTLANKVEVQYKKRATVYVPYKTGQDWLDVFNTQGKV